MSICAVITVLDRVSNTSIVINESDFDLALHKKSNEDAPRATSTDSDGGSVNSKRGKLLDAPRAARKYKR